jgi:alanyl-tRNA synthetase
VRVVIMGEPTVQQGNTMGWSVELCGGTHVQRTGEIGPIIIVAEGGVASGVRRIEALTGLAALKHIALESHHLKEVATLLRASPFEIAARLSLLLDERKRLERELSDAKKKLAMGGDEEGGGGTYARSSGFAQGTLGTEAAGNPDGVRQVGGTSFFARTVKDFDLKELRSLADEGKKRLASGVVAIVGISSEGKAGIVVGVTDDLTARFNAVDLVRKGAEALGGKGGGGRPDMAQAGGPDASKADAALAAIEAALGA